MQHVRIKGIGNPEVYIVAGELQGRGLWLTVEDDSYDGYDGDLVVRPDTERGGYIVLLQDDRSSVPRHIELEPAVQQYVWITAAGAFLFEAKDYSEAYCRVIANRLKASGLSNPNQATQEEVERQVRWFNKDDQLHEIDGEGQMGDIYLGLIPEVD